MDLCNESMSKYKEGTVVRGCSSHEFLEIPRPEWENFPPEVVNKKDETIDQWLGRIYKTHQDATISTEESRIVKYESQLANEQIKVESAAKIDARLESITQSGPSTNATTNIDW